MKKFFRWYIITGFILLIFIICPIAMYWITCSFILTPQKLQSFLQTELSNTVNGSFTCKSVKLSYLETWPLISISVNEGVLKSSPTVLKDSTLHQENLNIKFKKVFICLDVMDYIKEQKVTINKILIKEPHVYITSKQNNPINLIKKNKNSKSKLGILEIIVQKGKINWIDKDYNLTSELKDLDLKITGNLNSLNFSLSSNHVNVLNPQYAVNLNFPLRLNTQLAVESHNNSIKIKSATAYLKNIPFKLTGTLKKDPSKTIHIDSEINLLPSNFKDLVEYIPPIFLKKIKRYNVNGMISLQGNVKGTIADNIHPNISISGHLSDGCIVQKGQNDGLHNINMKFNFHNPFSNQDLSAVTINNLTISGLSSSISAKAEIKKIWTDPFFDLQLKSDIDLNRIGTEFLDPKKIQLSGDMKSDLSLVFKLRDLKKGHYDRVWADGVLAIKQLSLNSDHYNLSTYVSNTQAKIGYKTNKSNFIKQREILGAELKSDTLHFVCGPTMQMFVTDLNLLSNTGLQQDTSQITPITTHIKMKKIQAKISKEQAVILSNMNLHLGIKPSESQKQHLNIATAFTSDSIEYLNLKKHQATKILNCQLLSELAVHQENPFFFTNNNKKNTPAIKGYIQFGQLQSFSKNFPLQIKMYDTKLGLKNNLLILNNANVRIGESDALVSGNIKTSNLNHQTTNNFIQGNLDIKSNYLNLNELKKALLYKLNHQPKIATNMNEQLLNLENLENSLNTLEEKKLSAVKDQLLKVPTNCDLSISLNADKIDFRKIKMQNVDGEIRLKDEKALVDFSTRTNMGDIFGNLTYKFYSNRKADVFLNFRTNRIHVGELTNAFPEIQTLFPLLKDMNGVLDTKIISYFPLNSNVEIDLSSLYATCSLKGDKMVLLTNDIYHQIAQKLRFKDKKKNVIEHMDVDFIVKDRNIDVFPFVLDIDRCKFVVGGQHNMDMNFSYHIDVLKSYIPIDFGVNLKGKPGDFKYHIGKTKFKSTFNKPILYNEFKMNKERRLNETHATILKLADKL